MKFRGLSLFANAGIAETYLSEVGIDIVVANELLKERADFYSHLYPNTNMIVGDITDRKIFSKVIEASKVKKVNFIIATPPCQGMSLAGKREKNDVRNQLIYYAVEAIKKLKPQYVLLENVPQQLKTIISINGKEMVIPEYLHYELDDDYNFAQQSLVSAKDYGVPQMRKRNIVLLSRKDMNYTWEMPEPVKQEVTLRDVLWDLPSLDPLLKEGECETLKCFLVIKRKKMLGKKYLNGITLPNIQGG